jgi:F420-non-reducing hydrogenase small subunit
MADKPKVAFYWCASCGGCEETVVDLDEKVLDVVAAVDIVFWPCAMDPKHSDVEAMPDGSIAVAFINGAIRTSEQEHIAKLLRRKAATVVAFGSCACMGGIPALANLKSRGAIFERSYLDSPTVVNPAGTVPVTSSTLDGHAMTLPDFYDTVYTLPDVVAVDYFLPGCPPTAKVLGGAVQAILEGKLPPPGAVLLPDKALCTSCDRNASKPDSLTVQEYKRIHEVVARPDACFLAQGVLCMGPATRDSCEYPCVKGNMPCTGCFGPLSDADAGAKMIGALGGILEASSPEAITDGFAGVPDPAGTLYRYSLSSSLLSSRRRESR